MQKTIEQLQGEIRYTIRLCQRTARFYRRIQTIGTFCSIVGGSATMASFSATLPDWATITGASMLAIAGAALIAIRPADKAAINESDVKRYQSLMAKSHNLNLNQLQIALEECRQSDAPEIESLRNVAYNDIVQEINRPDQAIKLSATEKIWQIVA